jgi:hypothetical protein
VLALTMANISLCRTMRMRRSKSTVK